MIEIELRRLSKRFGRRWVIRELDATLRAGEMVGIDGRNGSGKTTLLRLISGQLTPSRGRVRWTMSGEEVRDDDRYRAVAWAGPYLELPEELTIAEFFDFHFRMKPLRAGLTVDDLPEMVELADARNRLLGDCSSGMLQRVMLGSVLYADAALLLLDEPTLTLDGGAKYWFFDQLKRFRDGRLVVIASNDAEDLAICDRRITLNSPK